MTISNVSKLRSRLETAYKAAAAQPACPMVKFREISIAGQLIRFLRDNPEEYLTSADLITKMPSFTFQGLYSSLTKCFKLHILQFEDDRIEPGPAFALAKIREPLTPHRNKAFRPGSDTYRFLVRMKQNPTRIFSMKEIPSSRHFTQAFGYVISEGLVEVLHIGGKRHIRSGPNLLLDPRVEANPNLERLHARMVAWRKMKVREFKIVIDRREFELLFALVDAGVKKES